jgi:ABC-2 type transport system ATP-binding protein
MVSAEPDLEEIFLTYYSEEEARHARAGVEKSA